MRKEGSSHLHSVGWSGPRYEGLCDYCRASCLGLFQQTQLVSDAGHLFLQTLSLDADLCDFLSSGSCQERLFEVYQVKGPLLLQTHQPAELIKLAVHIGLQLLCGHLRYVDEVQDMSERMNWAKVRGGNP